MNESKLNLCFFVRAAKNYFLVCCRILAISLCVPRGEKGWESLLALTVVRKMVGAIPGDCFSVRRRSFHISSGPSSWFAHPPCGHRPVPECQAPSGRLGILSSELQPWGPPQHAWVLDTFVFASQCSSLTVLPGASVRVTRHLWLGSAKCWL